MDFVKGFTSALQRQARYGHLPAKTGRFAGGKLGRYNRPALAPQGRGDWSGYGAAWAVTGTLLAGILVWGGIGYLLDRLADTGRLFMAIGMIVGVAGGIYIVYIRYGRNDDE